MIYQNWEDIEHNICYGFHEVSFDLVKLSSYGYLCEIKLSNIY